MLQNPKLLQIQSSLKLHSLIPPTHFQSIPTCPIIKQCCKLSRRELAIFSNSSLLLLLSSQSLEPFNLSKAKAEENLPGTSKIDQPEEKTGTNPNCSKQTPTKQAFLDISVDGEPVGRIIIDYGEGVPAGAARFSNLVSGAAVEKEVTWQLKASQMNGRQSECSGIKNSAGTVSIIVRDPLKPPPKLKLIARNGKLEIDKEKVGTDPNGTEFVIATGDSPDLDDSNLVIGRVLEGMEVVERIDE
ncbi:hypothetical protein GH714_029671 [Hevea brasiliensis]|uniref:PPIase cyclophilin-type domain-containing protein n=1 Tax=Hevea brasiliensis TaxID=3981 RepID=A0A6A6NJU0_HEVBR|nr:hypothetical protein GH714_029671 [Hevea brasiliensis]